jgi:uncharacterized protein YegL
MSESFGGGKASKAQEVADVINQFLYNLVLRCTPRDSVLYYFDIGVIGYSEPEGSICVGPAFGGILQDRDLIPINEVAMHPMDMIQIENDDGETVAETVWFRPVATGGTPMCKALRLAGEVLQRWVNHHPQSFPPIVINITDGESTDGDPRPEADKIKNLETNDGKVLLLNCHISRLSAPSIMFPNDETILPDDIARLVFEMSSILPESMLAVARARGIPIGEQARGFAFNAKLDNVTTFINIGTQTAIQLLR